MTKEEISKASREDLEEIVYRFYKSEAELNLVFTIQDKLESITEAFDNVEVFDISGKNSQAFENFMKFSKESAVIAENIAKIKKGIDPKVFERERAKRRAAKKGSPESFAANRKPRYVQKSDDS